MASSDTQQAKVADNLKRFRMGVASHDRENPTHPPAYGIGLTYFDMNCLGFEEGEELWPGIKLYADSGGTGNFRVLCSVEGQGSEPLTAKAVADDLVKA